MRLHERTAARVGTGIPGVHNDGFLNQAANLSDSLVRAQKATMHMKEFNGDLAFRDVDDEWTFDRW